MSNKTDIKETITSVMNGLFESIEAENNAKSAILTDRLCELYEECGDDYYQTSMQLEIMRLIELPAKPFLIKHPEIVRWDQFYIESIYNGLFSHWLRRTIDAIEGPSCGGDKEGFVTRCVIKSIVEQTNIPLYRTYGDYDDKYNDGKTDLNKQTYWSPSCFKDTDEVKEQFKKWWQVLEEA